jgi:hypothetical protein
LLAEVLGDDDLLAGARAGVQPGPHGDLLAAQGPRRVRLDAEGGLQRLGRRGERGGDPAPWGLQLVPAVFGGRVGDQVAEGMEDPPRLLVPGGIQVGDEDRDQVGGRLGRRCGRLDARQRQLGILAQDGRL